MPLTPPVQASGTDKSLSSTTTTSSSNDHTSQLPTTLSVLFVEDDPILRKLFVRSLKKICSSWTVVQATQGEDALEICRHQTFDLIFMDQYMASTNEHALLGTETIRVLREDLGVTASITGLSANELGEDFLRSGADHFVLKPLPTAREALIEQLLISLGRK